MAWFFEIYIAECVPEVSEPGLKLDSVPPLRKKDLEVSDNFHMLCSSGEEFYHPSCRLLMSLVKDDEFIKLFTILERGGP